MNSSATSCQRVDRLRAVRRRRPRRPTSRTPPARRTSRSSTISSTGTSVNSTCSRRLDEKYAPGARRGVDGQRPRSTWARRAARGAPGRSGYCDHHSPAHASTAGSVPSTRPGSFSGPSRPIRRRLLHHPGPAQPEQPDANHAGTANRASRTTLWNRASVWCECRACSRRATRRPHTPMAMTRQRVEAQEVDGVATPGCPAGGWWPSGPTSPSSTGGTAAAAGFATPQDPLVRRTDTPGRRNSESPMNG